MIRIAFYGKGGIGKSTVAANVSAALALGGRRVLHIGCDPKADSARLLTEMRIPTVLEQLAAKGKAVIREDLVFPGLHGVSCVESGGPQAGKGCAGLGITAMQEELNRLGILEEPWDAVVYDVLGDVVCGGFAVPIRKRYAERVYVVASGEYMALYAANNILRCVRDCSADGEARLGGLILNRCTDETDIRIGKRFAQRTNCSMAAAIPVSREIRACDYGKKCVVSEYPESAAALALNSLVKQILSNQNAACPVPMEAGELEAFSDSLAELGACASEVTG